MGINISAGGKGLAAILGAGAVLLAVLDKSEWIMFLLMAVVIFVISLVIRNA
jgi:hypothetical protein